MLFVIFCLEKNHTTKNYTIQLWTLLCECSSNMYSKTYIDYIYIYTEKYFIVENVTLFNIQYLNTTQLHISKQHLFRYSPLVSIGSIAQCHMITIFIGLLNGFCHDTQSILIMYSRHDQLFLLLQVVVHILNIIVQFFLFFFYFYVKSKKGHNSGLNFFFRIGVCKGHVICWILIVNKMERYCANTVI